MVNAQEWLDKKYPKEIRKDLKKLVISKQNLQGSLKLANFSNLQEFDCSNNQLETLSLINCQKLEIIDSGFNQLTSLTLPVNNQIRSFWCPGNKLASLPTNLNPLNLTILGLRDNFFQSSLTIFSQFVNLKKLYIGQNQFTGSLASLVNLTNLKELHVLDTQVDSGLEYLPEHLERFYCGGTRLFEILLPYMNPEYGAPWLGIPGKDGYYKLSKWKKDNQEILNKVSRTTINWQESIYPFKNFTKEITQEWINRGFSKNQSREWLENDLRSTDASFAQWLRDELKISPVQLLDNHDDEKLREQYADYLIKNSNYSNNWRTIDPSFTPELQQEWEEKGFSYQQTKKWLKSGLQPTDACYAEWLKNRNKDSKWFLEHGFEDSTSYMMFSHKGSFRRSKETKVNTQEWLDKNYPQGRRNIAELNINGKSLAGSLTIKNWLALETIYNEENHITDLTLADLPQLKKVYLTWDPLTSITIRNCPLITDIDLSSGDINNLDWLSSLTPENLTCLNVSDNKFPVQDLSTFSQFVNLEKLYLNSNNFAGSLESLKNLTKLETLNISYTKIDSGLEYLPGSIKEFICADTCLKEILKPYQGNLKKWRDDNQELINSLKKNSDKFHLETISSSKKNKNAKLREAKEEIVQLQIELTEERGKNADLQQKLINKEKELEWYKTQIEISPK